MESKLYKCQCCIMYMYAWCIALCICKLLKDLLSHLDFNPRPLVLVSNPVYSWTSHFLLHVKYYARFHLHVCTYVYKVCCMQRGHPRIPQKVNSMCISIYVVSVPKFPRRDPTSYTGVHNLSYFPLALCMCMYPGTPPNSSPTSTHTPPPLP